MNGVLWMTVRSKVMGYSDASRYYDELVLDYRVATNISAEAPSTTTIETVESSLACDGF